ncbi:hypothetical protein GR183_02650 [Stappia sp. GBMRC 2046]|uniref:SPW repeat-containing integral membrane domain-containing protein n=1 Tax=Stappia sediminis TaxID=2692190 RepID=A0A7X3S6A5_9HYPH|nr:hypothetical protein [Stappia sediminis]MXN63793.1 hypothetical protein [Stappia sediminis]
MALRFVTQKIHSWLDYPVAVSLVAMPFILGLGTSNPMAMWLAVITGVAAFILTVLTDHETGLIRVLPYSFHLLVDGLVGVTFLAAPFVLGFTGIDAWYYWANGIAVCIVVGLHKPAMDAMAMAR